MYDKPIKLTIINGYQIFFDPQHTLANKSGIVYCHRHVVSLALKRWISSDEHVHHKDGNRNNNDISNLFIATKQEHAKLHSNAINLLFIQCQVCGKMVHSSSHKIRVRKFCSQKCCQFSRRKIINRPSKETLLEELKTMNYVALGKKYNVSDNAIRKWLK